MGIGVRDDGGGRVAGEAPDEDPAYDAEPGGDENAVVQEGEGDTGEGVAGCVEEIAGVTGLLHHQSGSFLCQQWVGGRVVTDRALDILLLDGVCQCVMAEAPMIQTDNVGYRPAYYEHLSYTNGIAVSQLFSSSFSHRKASSSAMKKRERER